MAVDLKEFRQIHQATRLAGRRGGDLLDIPAGMLDYLLSVFGRRPGPAVPPEAGFQDWQDLLELLSPHSILPFVYWRLMALPESSHPPADIMDWLRSVHLISVARSLRQAAQLEEIEQAFARGGVRCLVLKGLALSRTVYPEPGLRPSVDIDLLVRPGEMMAADKILDSLGYVRKSDNFRLYRDFTIEEIYFSRDKDRCLVELHWDSHHFRGLRPPEGIEGLFDRAVPGPLPVSGYLCPIDALINASIHLAMQHSREVRLAWVLDIALLAKELKTPADWQTLKDRSRLWQVRPAVAHSLQLARLWFGLPLPSSLFPRSASFLSLGPAAFSPPSVSSALEDLVSDPPLSRAEKRAWQNARQRYNNPFRLFSIRGARSPASLWCFVFPPARIMKEKYNYRHLWQLPWCYVRRWLRLFQKC